VLVHVPNGETFQIVDIQPLVDQLPNNVVLAVLGSYHVEILGEVLEVERVFYMSLNAEFVASTKDDLGYNV
jgi:hypothetical protein